MTKLSLEANQLSGEMDDAWGDLVHLKVLNLGERLLQTQTLIAYFTARLKCSRK
jgi:hypothetical protein